MTNILKMDWKALGYNANWKDGMVVWEHDENYKDSENQNPSS